MHTSIDTSRSQIDRIDRQIVVLIAERMRRVRAIGAAKEAGERIRLLDATREREVFDRWTQAAAAAGLSSYYVGRVLRELLNYSRRVQEDLLDPRGGAAAAGASGTTRVGYQGVQSSYSHLALAKLFSCRARTRLERVGFRTFGAMLDALEAGEIAYAFLPIENTIAGSLNEVYRLLADRAVGIVDEEIWRVEHCLVALPGSDLAQLRTVRSHPVALQQCQRFLATLGHARAESHFDTAAAAESIVAEGDPTVAAICSAECAARLELEVIQEGIADHGDNFTRFVLAGTGAERVDRRLPCKTSLILTLQHRRGALADVLQIFARRNVNLTKLESRPQPDAPWEYLFYVDVEGHHEDEILGPALVEVRKHTNHCKLLGSYPRRRHELDEVPAGGAEVALAAAATRGAAGAGDAAVPPHGKRNGVPQPAAHHVERGRVTVGKIELGGPRFVLIAGPCAVESREQIFAAARMVRERGARVLRGGAFKPRTSPDSFQGLGFPGLELLAEAGRECELPVVSEVLRIEDVERMAERASALQVGARNMQNFALLKKLGTVDRPVLLKRGMSATLDELLGAAAYILAGGNQRVILCERGIRTFETATRATLDVSAIPVLRERTSLPIIVDPSHAAGRRELVVPLALAAAAAGADGLIVEAHPHPEAALCDGAQALTAADLGLLVASLEPIVRAQGRTL